MTFVNVINKTRYNVYHKTITSTIQIDFLIYLRLHQKYIISKLINKKLFNQRINFFKIIEVVNKSKQIYRLKLSLIIKIHSIMSIIQLKFVIFDIDFYNRMLNIESFSIKKQNNDFTNVIFDNNFASHYEIEIFLNKRISCD